MELREAIAHHKRTWSKLDDYKNLRIYIDEATFAELGAESEASLLEIVEAPEAGDADFLEKLRYLAAFYSSRRNVTPALWQIDGALWLAIWRKFGWSETNKPRF